MKNSVLYIFLHLAFFLWGFTNIFPQGEVPDVDLFTIDEGLSQTRANTVYQDKLGFLWIGTQDGLNRYDGYSFKIYRHQPSDSTSLSNNNINAVAEDKKGNLWIGTNDGLNCFNRTTNTFQRFYHDPFNATSIRGNVIYSVFVDKAGAIWVKTLEMLDKIDPTTYKITHFPHYNNVFSFIPDNNYFSIYEDSKGMLWVGTKEGLCFFDRNLSLFKRFSHDSNNHASISSDRVKSIYEDKVGNLWIGTDNGLNLFDRKKETFRTFIHDPKLKGSINNNSVNAIFEDHNGNLWVGTDAGLTILNRNRFTFASFEELHYRNNYFKPTGIRHIIEDRTHILWIACLQGLIKYDLKDKKFDLFRHIVRNDPNYSNNNISSIFQDKNRFIWIGTSGSGLYLYNRRTGNLIHCSESQKDKKFHISNDFIHSICEDNKGYIWLGTRDGLDVFNPATTSFEKACGLFPGLNCDLFKNNRVYSIVQDRKGNMWFATNQGLHQYLPAIQITKSHYFLKNDSFLVPINRVYTVICDHQGNIWMGTDFGITRYEPEKNRFFHFERSRKDVPGELSNNSVYSICESSSGDIWIGTASGLNLFDKENGTFKVLTENDGLPNNLIYGILEDNNKDLWLSTNHGLAKFNPASHIFTTFDLSDGLQGYEYNIGACFKSKTGELFFGGPNGLNSFIPDSLQKNIIIPPVVITNFEMIDRNGQHEISVEKTDTIVIPYGTKVFTIEFAALDFTLPFKNHYTYLMQKKGGHDKWIDIGNNHSATFSATRSGEYLFQVKGSNSDLVWNDKGVSVVILIETPFWNTDKAYVIYGLLISGLIYLYIQVRLRRLQRSNKILREKEATALKISKQKEELSLKNKNITDSISYARRIQQAMMPSEKTFRRIMPDSFVYHKPKDIVSGDFYWINEHKNKVFVAAADCTGHGVPGAFMSIIGFEFFRKITNVEGIQDPALILDALKEDFEKIFQGEESIILRDGMDIAFCVIDKNKRCLDFAGAFNPLYLIRENKLIEVGADRFSIGLDEINTRDHHFQSHHIDLMKDDMIYIFSDGYADQFGGPEGKKYKYRRFRHLLLTIHKLSPEVQQKLIDESIKDWMGNNEQVDDILVIGIKPFV
jgi:ligand-binding sensor domain-containing protein/serine phosphatase RsbU (regulator of sigma subunit)